MIAQARCTVSRAKKIITVLWISAALLALPLGYSQVSFLFSDLFYLQKSIWNLFGKILIAFQVKLSLFSTELFVRQTGILDTIGPNGETWRCQSRVKNPVERNFLLAYHILVFWFVPLALLLFTYTSVAISLVRSIKQTSSLTEMKRWVTKYFTYIACHYPGFNLLMTLHSRLPLLFFLIL